MQLSMQSIQITVTHTLAYHKIKSDLQKIIYGVSLTNYNTLLLVVVSSSTSSLFNASQKS